MAFDEKSDVKRVFISHSSANATRAEQLSAALAAAGGIDPWLDKEDIRAGRLLRRQLQEAIGASQVVVLLWSSAASRSRWVAAEILTAFQLDRFVIPCRLSEVALPQFLSRSVHLELRGRSAGVLDRLVEQVRQAPRGRNEFMAVRAYEDQDLKTAIARIYDCQRAELDASRDVGKALRLHAETDKHMRAAEKRWRFDPTILNLAGYHRKNAYMFRHWAEYSAGRFPEDPVLAEGERFFFETLFVNPTDYGALNGLGNILLFEGELEAAELFVEKAIEWAERAGVRYEDAIHDLGVIRRRERPPDTGTLAEVRGAPGA
jgi:hypothetical protein